MKKIRFIVQMIVSVVAFLCISAVTVSADNVVAEISVTEEKSAVPDILMIAGGVILFVFSAVSVYKFMSKFKK